MKIESVGICSFCKKRHAKTIRINASGQIHVPRPHNALLQLAEPECVQRMWQFNRTYLYRPKNSQASEFILQWMFDMFIDEHPPTVILHSENDQHWYEKIVFKLLERGETQPSNIQKRLIYNLLEPLPNPTPSFVHRLIRYYWRYQRTLSTIVNDSGFSASSLSLQFRLNLWHLGYSENLIETLLLFYPKMASESIIRQITYVEKPSDESSESYLLLDTSDRAIYFIIKLDAKEMIEPLQSLLELILRVPPHPDYRTRYYGFRQFLLTTITPTPELQPLLEQLKTHP